jgi:hypothetical protein
MRMRLKDINWSIKRLADGTTTLGEAALALTLNPGHPSSFASTTKQSRHTEKGVRRLSALSSTTSRTRASSRVSATSKRAYAVYLKLIEAKFGTMPIGAVEDKRSRGDFKEFRDSFSDTPRKADYVWTTIARVLSVAKDRGKIAVNVCERGGRPYDSDRSEIIWTAEDNKQFCAAASDELQAALLLALWTGQRQGDLLRLTWKGLRRLVHPDAANDRARAQGPAARDHPGRPAAEGCAGRGIEKKAIGGHHLSQFVRSAMDRGRVQDELGQSFPEDVAQGPALP